MHAIGDRANREALDAFERRATSGTRRPATADRARAVPRTGGRARFAALGVACSVQFSHAPSDRDLAERFWPEQVDGAYAFRSLLGLRRAGRERSDAPVEELDPLAGIRAGVLRTIDERPAVAPRAEPDGRAGAHRDHRRTRLAHGRRAPPREAPPRLPRRPRRPLARSARVPARGARDGRGRRDDGRRPLGAQPSALGLTKPSHHSVVQSARGLSHDAPDSRGPDVLGRRRAEIVGSKWTVLIVHDLSEGPRRFTELERSCAGSVRERSPSASAGSRRRRSSSATAIRSHHRGSSTR